MPFLFSVHLISDIVIAISCASAAVWCVSMVHSSPSRRLRAIGYLIALSLALGAAFHMGSAWDEYWLQDDWTIASLGAIKAAAAVIGLIATVLAWTWFLRIRVVLHKVTDSLQNIEVANTRTQTIEEAIQTARDVVRRIDARLAN